MYNRSKITYPHGNKTAKGSCFKKIDIGVRHTLLKRAPGTEKKYDQRDLSSTLLQW